MAPLFAEASGYGHLMVDSPCIDQIETSSVEFDIDGDLRPFPELVGYYDMGADEYVWLD